MRSGPHTNCREPTANTSTEFSRGRYQHLHRDKPAPHVKTIDLVVAISRYCPSACFTTRHRAEQEPHEFSSISVKTIDREVPTGEEKETEKFPSPIVKQTNPGQELLEGQPSAK